MPRIAQPTSTAAIRARDALSAYLLRSGMSANAIARAAGVGQPTVSRFLSGRTKTITPAVRPLLRYAKIEIENGITQIDDVLDNPRLRDALRRFVGDRRESAELLAQVIEALGPVINSAPFAATRSRL